MKDTLYPSLKRKLDEVYALTPNDLHNSRLNVFFKFSTRLLKSFPFKILIPFSILAAVAIYLILGYLVVRLVTLLQYGF